MIRVVYCIRKRAELSPEAFRQYWLGQHRALFLRFAEALGAKRVIQSPTIEPEINEFYVKSRRLASPYDGITEIWWEDSESFKAAASSPAAQEARKAIIEDEAKFIDFSQSRAFMTEEQVIFNR